MRRILAIFTSLAFFACAVAFTHAQVPMTGAGLTKPTAAGGGCSQATTFLARTSLAGSDVTNYTALICGLVTDGIITGTLGGATGCGTKIDVFYILATADSTTALLNICGTSFGGTANGAPSFTAYRGFTGVDASATVFIDTGFNASTAGGAFSTNSAHLSGWSNTNATSGASGGVIIGVNGDGTFTANLSNIFPKYNDGNAYFRANDPNNSGTVFVNANSTGHYIANRSGASASQAYINGSALGSPNTTAGTLVSANIAVLGLNNPATGHTFGGGYQVPMASIGGSLSSTDAANFYSRLRTYMTAVGVP